jgi:hypothetical protein
MDESFGVDGDADVQLLVLEPHEHEVAGTYLIPRYRYTASHLLMGGAR